MGRRTLVKTGVGLPKIYLYSLTGQGGVVKLNLLSASFSLRNFIEREGIIK